MKKRLLSLLLVLAVVFSFSLSAFATDTGIDIIDDPLSYYFENQMLGVQKGTGVTLVCPKCDYKVVYTGGTLVTCPYDGEALVLADLAGVHAEKVPSGIGRKDLPGYIDNSGTAHVSKEGKLKFVAHPCWLDVGEQESNKFTLTDPYKPYRVQEEDEDYGLYVYDWLGYNNGISHFSLYTQPLSDDIWPPRRTLYETNAFPIILDSRCRNNGKSHTLGTFPYARARLQAPRWGCDGGPVRIVGPPRAVPPKGTLTLPFRQLIFGARLAGTEVKRGWRFSPCSKYYPGGVEICGAEKILPDLYFCDGQAIMSMKLTEGST